MLTEINQLIINNLFISFPFAGRQPGVAVAMDHFASASFFWSQASTADPSQRVQPGDNFTGFGKLPFFTHRQIAVL